MGHKSLTCIFANAMQQTICIATATGTQIWPHHKKVKGHPYLIILTNLVGLESSMPYTKIQPQSSLSTEEEDFWVFYYIRAWQPSCSMIQNHWNKMPTSLWQKAPCEFWWKLVKWFQRRRRLNISRLFFLYIAQLARTDNPKVSKFWSLLKRFTTLIIHCKIKVKKIAFGNKKTYKIAKIGDGLNEYLLMQHCSLRGCIRPLKRYLIFKITSMGSMIPKEIKYNLAYDDVRGDFVRTLLMVL